MESEIRRAEHELRIALARQRIDAMVADFESGKLLPDAAYDEIRKQYAVVLHVAAGDPRLDKDPELTRLLERLRSEEPERVKYETEEPGREEAGTSDGFDAGRQGNTLVVAWGKEAGAAPASGRDQVVLALARGILYLFDAEGRLLCSRRLGSIRTACPAGSPAARLARRNHRRLVGDNTLLALALEATREHGVGDVLWRYRVGQDIVAPLTIVPRQTNPNDPVRHCGLLPPPPARSMPWSSCWGNGWAGSSSTSRSPSAAPTTQPRAGLLPRRCPAGLCHRPGRYRRQAAEALRLDPLHQPRQRAIHSEAVVVGPYLLMTESSELEHTNLRVFQIGRAGLSGRPTSRSSRSGSAAGTGSRPTPRPTGSRW